MTYGLFLGCIAPNRYPGIESATREMLKILGIDFIDIENASCCPAPGIIKSFDKKSWLVTGTRNLCLAEKLGVDILTICNGCYGTLFDIAYELRDDEKLRSEVNDIISDAGFEYKGSVNVQHFVDVLFNEVTPRGIQDKVKKPQELDVAVHYGCHFLRPSKYRKLADVGGPGIVEKLIEAVGAKNIDYLDKDMCCGAGGGVRARVPNVALEITDRKLGNIKKSNAKCIVDICPFCHLQFDHGQKVIGGYNYPVLHLSQLLALAFGVDKDKLGFEAHVTPVNI